MSLSDVGSWLRVLFPAAQSTTNARGILEAPERLLSQLVSLGLSLLLPGYLFNSEGLEGDLAALVHREGTNDEVQRYSSSLSSYNLHQFVSNGLQHGLHKI